MKPAIGNETGHALSAGASRLTTRIPSCHAHAATNSTLPNRPGCTAFPAVSAGPSCAARITAETMSSIAVKGIQGTADWSLGYSIR